MGGLSLVAKYFDKSEICSIAIKMKPSCIRERFLENKLGILGEVDLLD